MSRVAFTVLFTCLLLCCGCQQTAHLYDLLRGETPLKAAAMMESEDPNERWQGINRLVRREFAQRDPYTDRYEQIAKNDPSPLVRAVAIRALNRSRDQEAAPTLVAALADADPMVRLEAAKALVHLPDTTAAEPLARIVADANENKDIRIAAADALRHYPRLDVARSLIAQLSGRDFGLAWQSRRSLRRLTGEDFRYDEAAWLNFLTAEQPFG